MAFLPLPTPPTTHPARTRTPKQLQRKRTLDKVSQKRKRDQQKAHVASIERDLQDARAENERLRSVIRDMQEQSEQAARHGDPVEPDALDPYAPHVSAPMREGPNSGVALYARRSSPPPLPPARKPTAIECYCRPKMHRTYSECFERTVFDGVMNMHRSPMPVPPVPATPELADLLFMREPRDSISNILHKLARRSNMDSMVIICAVYIVAHRILRYRFFPSIQTYNDVPEWLRSTNIQDGMPHPLYIDFVQFPRLRDAMVLGSVSIDEIREAFDTDFGHHLSVNWPASKSLLVADDMRRTTLHPEFERHVCTEENWSLDADFAKKYPHIAPLVTIKD